MPAGRPSEFKPEYIEEGFRLTLLGATDKDLAEEFDVTEQTVNNWKREYPEFFESVRRGKAFADAHVANSLYERAKGCEWVEQQAIKVKVGKDQERVEVVEVTRRAPPDTTAASFWLKNRRRDLWRDKVDHEMTGKDGGAIEINDSDLARRALFALAKLTTGEK